MNDGLVELFDYNLWATATLLEGCRQAPTELLQARVPGISDSVAALLTHLVGGQQTFALRTKGRQHEGELNRRSAFPGWDELARLADESGRELREVARTAADGAYVELAWQGATSRLPLRFILTHAIEHATEHRTEIKVALGAQGFATPDLDGWSYAAAKGYGASA